MTVVSHRDFHATNKLRIEEMLKKNNFPMPIIQKLFRQIITSSFCSNSVVKQTYSSIQLNGGFVQHQDPISNKRKSYPFLLDETRVELRYQPPKKQRTIRQCPMFLISLKDQSVEILRSRLKNCSTSTSKNDSVLFKIETAN